MLHTVPQQVKAKAMLLTEQLQDMEEAIRLMEPLLAIQHINSNHNMAMLNSN
jgi:hypothetical protein